MQLISHWGSSDIFFGGTTTLIVTNKQRFHFLPPTFHLLSPLTHDIYISGPIPPACCLPWAHLVCRPGSTLGCDTPWRDMSRAQRWRVWGAWWWRRWGTGPRGSRCPESQSGCGRLRHPFGCSTAWWNFLLLPPPHPTVCRGRKEERWHKCGRQKAKITQTRIEKKGFISLLCCFLLFKYNDRDKKKKSQ